MAPMTAPTAAPTPAPAAVPCALFCCCSFMLAQLARNMTMTTIKDTLLIILSSYICLPYLSLSFFDQPPADGHLFKKLPLALDVLFKLIPPCLLNLTMLK